MADKGPVLMVGGTGALGRKVVSELLNRDHRVRMLVRDPVKAEEFARRGVELVRGDMMDPRSLTAAIDGSDAVITCAAGYTRHSAKDTAETDTVGNRNLVDAAAAVGVRRFVLTSILTCDKTPQVPHFWHKKLVEDHLAERGVPYVALRPGAFLDSVTQFGGDPFARGRLIYAGSARVPFTFVWTTDVAEYLARAVDVAGVDGQHIDIGWTRPVTVEDVAEIAAQQLQKPMRTTVIPGRPLSALGTLIGWANPYFNEMAKMFRWFQSGEYVADIARQREVFGPPPAPEQAVAGFLRELGHLVTVEPRAS
jgi:uncharacterized protein YbjT (DUF2867 family)